MPDPVAEEQFIAVQLRAAGLRVTGGRLAVFQAAAAPGHHDTEALTSAAREQRGELSSPAVHDALKVLCGLGLVRRIEPAPIRGEIPCLTT